MNKTTVMAVLTIILSILCVSVNGDGRASWARQRHKHSRKLQSLSSYTNSNNDSNFGLPSGAFYSFDYNLSNYTCFSPQEIDSIKSKYNLSIDLFTVGNNSFKIGVDDWGLTSWAAMILMKEFMGFDVTYASFYDYAFEIVSNETGEFDIPWNHLEIWQTDLVSSKDDPRWAMYTATDAGSIQASLIGVTSQSFWALSQSAYQDLMEILPSNEYYLNWWETYTSDIVIAAMTSKNDSNIEIFANSDEYWLDYKWPCSVEQNCSNQTSTWLPEWCINDVNSSVGNTSGYGPDDNDDDLCGRVLSWIPSYSTQDRYIINKYKMNLGIVYSGVESSWQSMSTISNAINNSERILFSIWSPSIFTSTDDFYLIGLPTELQISQGCPLYKLINKQLMYQSKFGFDFLRKYLSVHM